MGAGPVRSIVVAIVVVVAATVVVTSVEIGAGTVVGTVGAAPDCALEHAASSNAHAPNNRPGYRTSPE